jgi:hypothetical protein
MTSKTIKAIIQKNRGEISRKRAKKFSALKNKRIKLKDGRVINGITERFYNTLVSPHKRKTRRIINKPLN